DIHPGDLVVSRHEARVLANDAREHVDRVAVATLADEDLGEGIRRARGRRPPGAGGEAALIGAGSDRGGGRVLMTPGCASEKPRHDADNADDAHQHERFLQQRIHDYCPRWLLLVPLENVIVLEPPP